MAGSAPTNSSAVDFEKQQAQEADAKEAQRQANLTQGQAAINAIFDPQPVMQTTQTPYDWSKFQAPAAGSRTISSGGGWAPGQATGVPAGYTAVQIPGKAAGGATTDASGRPALLKGTPNTANALSMNSNNTLSGYNAGAGGAAGSAAPSTWGLQDSSGKIYNPGDPLSISSQTPDPSGKTTGGFGDDFYNAYNQKVLDYYQPQEAKQYSEAQRDLTYGLARAGTLQSSTAADKTGELGYQDALNKANIVANANSQTGQLRDQIQANKSSLINQLYATDDPSLANSAAETSAHASELQNPTLTPMASLFAPVVTGATSALQGYNNPYNNPYNPNASTGAAPVASALGTGSSKVTGFNA